MKRIAQMSIAAAALLLAAGAQAACYTVLDGRGEILSQTSTPPVDMSRPLHQTVTQRFGEGAVMVFGIMDENCGPEAEPFEAMADDAATGQRRVRRAARRDRG